MTLSIRVLASIIIGICLFISLAARLKSSKLTLGFLLQIMATFCPDPEALVFCGSLGDSMAFVTSFPTDWLTLATARMKMRPATLPKALSSFFMFTIAQTWLGRAGRFFAADIVVVASVAAVDIVAVADLPDFAFAVAAVPASAAAEIAAAVAALASAPA